MVRMNHRNRSLSFLVAGVAFVVHVYPDKIHPLLWILLFLQFLVVPHVLYLRSRASPHPVKLESRYTLLDAFTFGFWCAVVGFAPWITFMCLIGAFINPIAFRGKRGLFEGAAAFVVGVLLALAFVGFQFVPETSLAVTALVGFTLLVYLVSVAIGIHDRASVLHQISARLRESETSLKEQLERVEFLQEQLREKSLRDPLTQLHNRRFFEPALEREVASARRSARHLALVVLDIDHFKRINDTYGHPEGDSVLCALADLLRSSLRTMDFAVRLGGEEFAVLLPDTALQAAAEKAEQLRRDWAQTRVQAGENQITSTLSAGVTVLESGEDTVAAFFKRADAALYQAKEAGRNRVVHISGPTAP
jgi:diguanylate cyclase